MKPPPFTYVDPQTVPEVLDALDHFQDEGKALAGGQSLIPLLNMRLAQPRALIDLNGLSDLAYIQPCSRNGASGIAIGAMTRQRAVEEAGAELTGCPLLAEGVSCVGHSQIRNRGTIGGSIAHADPVAELPLVFRALDGLATVHSKRGVRVVPAGEFFRYTFTTAIEADELLTEVWLPIMPAHTGHAFVEVARRHGDFALVAVAATLTVGWDGRCAAASIAIGGAASTPMRAESAERSLMGEQPGFDVFRSAGTIAAGETEPTSDVHADATYRREVAGALVRRALTLAWERIPKEDA